MKMNAKILIGLVGVGLIAVSAPVMLQYYRSWQATQPTAENFQKAVSAMWDGKLRNQNGGLPIMECAAVPAYPAPDARSKSQQPMAWHMDFLVDKSTSPERERQLRQLDVLTTKGFLNKTAIEVDADGSVRAATRYTLNNSGWAASPAKSGLGCISYGEIQVLGISGFEPKILSEKAGLEVYLVRVKLGIAITDPASNWARDPVVLEAFPDIKKKIAGEVTETLFVRGAGQWMEYGQLLRDEQRRREDARVAAEFGKDDFTPEYKRHMEELRNLPGPTEEEVKALVAADYKNPTWRQSCMFLPGSGRLPVDRSLTRPHPSTYGVAIFSNVVRKPSDQVAGRTIPYLEQLERAGILKKTHLMGLPRSARDSPDLQEGDLYELASPQTVALHEMDPTCLPLGPPTVEFISVHIRNEETFLGPSSSFSYKLRLYFKEPPNWAHDAKVLENWPELRLALERGRACEGRDEFDRKTRKRKGGNLSDCWWAFDSFENS